MIQAGITGGAGYTAGELIRLMLHHPQAEISFVHSNSHAGKHVHDVHRDLLGETDLVFTDEIRSGIDVLFLCHGHGKSAEFLNRTSLPDHVKVIDLSSDFRLRESSVIGARKFVYGLPELHRENIRAAGNIANPGCFATAIQLALLPLAVAGQLKDHIHVHAITGSTGAGQAPGDTTHFSWRSNNVSVYKPFQHQHLAEITEGIRALDPGFDHALNFIPVRGNFTRGIFATAYTACDIGQDELSALYRSFYRHCPFTVVSDLPLSLKEVVNTSRGMVHSEKINGHAFITCIIDNLLKGASGQAVQNMNLMFAIDETAGLKLKPVMF